MAKLRVAVLFGGRSGEHEVSLVSAASVLQSLDRRKYEIVPVGITLEGRWLSAGGAAARSPERVLREGRPVLLPPEPAPAGAARRAEILRADVALPILHGTFGEDGTIQGLLELCGIPYVGAGVLASAVGMDKEIMKRLFVQAGLPIVPWLSFRRRQWRRAPESVLAAVVRRLDYPVFVKPANLGSSVGISKARDREQLRRALQLAARYDTKLIVEQGVDAREIECSVLGNDDPRASLPGEILPGREFYDYEAKYLETGTQYRIPAPLAPGLRRRVQQLAIGAFRAVDCSGLARVDFLLARRGAQLWVNEINTMPGFTPISMFPKLWAVSGLPYPRLLDRMIALALERARERAHNRYQR